MWGVGVIGFERSCFFGRCLHECISRCGCPGIGSDYLRSPLHVGVEKDMDMKVDGDGDESPNMDERTEQTIPHIRTSCYPWYDLPPLFSLFFFLPPFYITHAHASTA